MPCRDAGRRERGDVGGFDDAPDGKRRAELTESLLQVNSEERRRWGVSTKPAAIRLTRTGASLAPDWP